MKTIIISTSSFNKNNLPCEDFLKKHDLCLKFNPFRRRLKEEEISSILDGDSIGLIAGVEQLTARVFRSAPNLKAIARCGSGLDNVDLKAANALGIIVSNTPKAPVEAVAELTLAHMLNLLRRISIADRDIRCGSWKPQMGHLLARKHVGIVGFGRIGRKVSELVRAFGANVYAYDQNVTNFPNYVIKMDLSDLLRESDVVSIHLPYGPETYQIINKTNMAQMKKGAILLNLSRGGLVDEEAVVNSIKCGQLFGAGFDTFEQEPYYGPLRDCENVILTAHMGSYAKETREEQEIEAVNNLLRDLKTVKAIVD